MSAAMIAAVSSESDIFAHRSIQTSELGTIQTAYKPIAPVDQNDLKFFIPSDNDNYMDLDTKLYVPRKLISPSRKDVDFTDLTTVSNNFLRSLFSQCNDTLNGVTITQESEHYHYRSYLETLMRYGTDASLPSIKRVLVTRNRRHAVLRPYERDSLCHDEPVIHHSLEQT